MRFSPKIFCIAAEAEREKNLKNRRHARLAIMIKKGILVHRGGYLVTASRES